MKRYISKSGKLTRQMQKAISSCEQSIQHEGTHAKVPLQPIIVTAPLDFTSNEMTMELDQPPNMVNVLVFCDHFTKQSMAYVTPDQTPKTVAMFLWQGYISIFRAPAKLLSDQGANFESNIIKEPCELIGIQKVRTSPYHAQTNRQVEWAHQMLMHMTGKLSKDWKADWPNQNWYMHTTLWDWLSLDTVQTTWCLGTKHAYPSTFISPW